MATYLIKRFFLMLPTVFTVVTVVFFMVHAIPGDPVDFILGDHAFAADRTRIEHELKLDLPISEQYTSFMVGLVKGDWGRSIYSNKPVMALIKERYGATLELATTAIIFTILIALPLGMIAALKKGTWVDSTAMAMSLVGISVPAFWMGPLLIILFSLELGVLPAAGRDAPGSIILPALTLGMALAAMLARMTRSSMLDALGQEYVATARAKGASETRVVLKHVLRNALIPIVTILGLQIGVMLAGAIVTEKIFSWPGLGSLLITSIERRDYPVVQGCVMIIALTYVVVNAFTDCVYKMIDPRIKLGAR